MQSYIGRVSRRDPDNKDAVAGIVEKVGTHQQTSFLDLSELKDILVDFIKSDDFDYSAAKQIDMYG